MLRRLLMRGGNTFSRFGRRFSYIAVAALLAASAISARQSSSLLRRQSPTLNAVPATLGPSEYFAGKPWIGQPPVTITVAELMEREANAEAIAGPPRERRHEQAEHE